MTETSIYPLTFTPIFKDYVWGGRNLAEKLGRTIPDGIVAESWEIAAHPDGSSTVSAGPLAGKTLADVQELLGEALVGARNRRMLELGRFPLLVKLLDANRWLSVQVHPDDAYALAHGNDLGKTEMWIVLYAEPDAELIYGFKAGVTKEAFADAIVDGTVEQWLHRIAVKPGDVVFVPAGTVHALGTGVIVAEIQQNSNTTYRIYDWGRPRPIHVQQALDVLDFDQIEPDPLTPKLLDDTSYIHERIGRCDYFQTERFFMAEGDAYTGNCDGSTLEIWGVLEGEAVFTWDGAPVTVDEIGWVLLPAALGSFQVEVTSDSTLIRVFTP
ncbi:MAG: mannose-6-phosphate isomerase, class I [Caldilineaceae bacterium]